MLLLQHRLGFKRFDWSEVSMVGGAECYMKYITEIISVITNKGDKAFISNPTNRAKCLWKMLWRLFQIKHFKFVEKLVFLCHFRNIWATDVSWNGATNKLLHRSYWGCKTGSYVCTRIQAKPNEMFLLCCYWAPQTQSSQFTDKMVSAQMTEWECSSVFTFKGAGWYLNCHNSKTITLFTQRPMSIYENIIRSHAELIW